MIKKCFFGNSKCRIKFFDHLRINLGILHLKKIFFYSATGKTRFLIFLHFITVIKKTKNILIKILNFSRVLGILKNVFFNLKKKI